MKGDTHNGRTKTYIRGSRAVLIWTASSEFRPNDFNSVIWAHGYDIICEKAIRCPCQGNSGSPLPDCQNCHGFGYFFVNPRRTKALVTGLNRNTQYVQWAPELMGTAAITVRDEDKDFLSYFDRVTVEDEYASFTEMLVAREMIGDEVAVFLSYAPIEDGIVAVYTFKDSESPLIKLDPSVYEIVPENPYCLRFAPGTFLQRQVFQSCTNTGWNTTSLICLTKSEPR